MRCAKPRTRNCSPTGELFEELADPYVLYLALLLHDTGKGVGARPHSEASALFAQSVAARLQLTPEQRRSLVLLVDHHVTLSSMAQQRNVDDPATVIELANIVKSQSNLDALMLLTLADGQGTTDTWSDWKESLVWHLYHATARYLLDQEGFIAQVKIEREQLRQAVAEKLVARFRGRDRSPFRLHAGQLFPRLRRRGNRRAPRSFSHSLAQHLPARRAGLRPRAALGGAAGTGPQRGFDLHLGPAAVSSPASPAPSPSPRSTS